MEHSSVKSIKTQWVKSSHRSVGEQAIGLAIFLILFLASALASEKCASLWARAPLPSPSWILSAIISSPFWTMHYILGSLAIWSLWRRHSIRILKLELSVFLIQIPLTLFWFLSFAVFDKALLGLAVMLFLCSSTLLATILYWKKEKIAGFVLAPTLFWIFLVMGVNMFLCIHNP